MCENCENCERLHKILDGAPSEKGEMDTQTKCPKCDKSGGIHLVTQKLAMVTGHVFEAFHVACTQCDFSSVAIIKPTGGDVARTLNRLNN